MKTNGDLGEDNPNTGPLEKLNTIQEQTPTVAKLGKVKAKCLDWDLKIDGRKGKRREKIDKKTWFPMENVFRTTIERLKRVGYQKQLDKLAGSKSVRTSKECGYLSLEFPA
jgi:hypothetical protein